MNIEKSCLKMVILSHYFNTGMFNLMFHMINKPAFLVEV